MNSILASMNSKNFLTNELLTTTRRLVVSAALMAAAGWLQAQAAGDVPTLEIQADQVAAKVSPTLYGLMTEEINYSYDGGLYAELVRNRNFKESAVEPRHWQLVQEGGGAGTMALATNQPINAALTTCLQMDVSQVSGNQKVGIANDGFWGIPVQPNTRYRASFYAKADGQGGAGPLTVALVSSTNNSMVYASAPVKRITGEWQKYEVTLKTGKVEPTKDALLLITAGSPGTVWFNLVSLFPPTWNDRPNGNRKDIMQLLADMKPTFLRFPGGNYLEGQTFATRFDWKKTIGDIAQRPGHFCDAWRYWSSDGMGLLEFLEWCEDLEIQPVLGVYAAYSMRQGAVTNELDACVQEALDEIEYVTGSTKTKWGAQRAQDGHRAPFKLEYVEIGNEDNLGTGGRTYDLRFTRFYDAIKAKYPNLKIISSAPSSTRIVTSRTPDVVDDHYYRSPQDLQLLASHYDNYDRSRPKVFVGEYASQSPGTNRQVTPNLGDALGDAAFLTGLERNSDVVVLASYAPLFVNVNPGGMQWRTDLIGYDALSSFGSPSYYAQLMFSQNHGDVVLPIKAEDVPSHEWQPPAGRRGGGPRPPVQLPSLFFVATRDSGKRTIYLKLVNTLGTPQPVRVLVKGVKSIAARGESVVLAADSSTATNTINEPTKVVPVTTAVDGLSTDFTRTLPPYSVTILKLRGS